MSLIERNREPTTRELVVFGALLAPFFGLVGAVVLWKTESWLVATVLWGIGLLLAVVYLLSPSIRRPTYMMWMALLYPIGWAISHLILALVYYGWVTPIGLLMRLFGYDPMRRRLGRQVPSNWIRRKTAGSVGRYFRQY